MGKATEYTRVAVDKLIPYVNNAKQHSDSQVTRIASSIREFGFLNPVLIDADYNVIAGHGRILAAKKLGLTEVPCLFVEGLTDAQRKAYILADNRLSELGEWDMELVMGELAELDELGFDTELTGFEFEVEPEITDDEDDIPEPPAEPKAKLGDLYQLGRHRLICGDSTDVNVIERLIGGATIDLVLTDPPYGINIVNDNGKVGAGNLAKNRTYSKVIADDTTDTAEAAFGILSNVCDKLIVWGGNYFTKFLPFSDGWIIWDKRVNMTSNNFADGEMAWCSFHTPVRIYHQLWNGMIREGDREDRVHPTQKPTKMLGEVVRDFSDIGDAIVDVFGGSGSTLIACEQLDRTCYMCELDPKYIDVIIERWENLTGEKAVLISE